MSRLSVCLFALLLVSAGVPDRSAPRAVIVILPSPPSVAVGSAVGDPVVDEVCRERVQQIYDALVVLIGVWPGHSRVRLPGRDWPEPGESLWTHHSFSYEEWKNYGEIHPLEETP